MLKRLHDLQSSAHNCTAWLQCSIPARNDAGATFRILTSPGCVYPPRFCYVLTRTSGAVISVQRAPPGNQIGADAARKRTENRPKMTETGTFGCTVARGFIYPRWKLAGVVAGSGGSCGRSGAPIQRDYA